MTVPLSSAVAELDLVPIIMKAEGASDDVDEVSDSMAKKCVM